MDGAFPNLTHLTLDGVVNPTVTDDTFRSAISGITGGSLSAMAGAWGTGTNAAFWPDFVAALCPVNVLAYFCLASTCNCLQIG